MPTDSNQTTITFPLSEIHSHVLSNTPTYWKSVKPAPVNFKAEVCKSIANSQLDKGLKAQALATLSILSRLPSNETKTTHDVVKLHAEVERDRPFVDLLPPSFRIVHSYEEEYRQVLATGIFSARELAFRTTSLGRQLYQMAAYHRARDISFVLFHKSSPQVHVRFGIHLDEGATDCSAPIKIQLATGLPDCRAFQATEAALDALEELCRRFGAANFRVEDSEVSSKETYIGRAIRSRSYITNFCVSLSADLTADEATMWRGVRESYRSLINGSAKKISIRRFSSILKNEDVVQCWTHLCGVTKNMFTESLVSLIVGLVRDGNGEISAGFAPDGHCIGVTVILDDCGKSLYYAGHYIEGGDGTRHSHFMVFDAMARARERKSSCFYFSLFDPNQFEACGILFSVDSCMEQGRHFMRGFTPVAERHLTYVKIL